MGIMKRFRSIAAVLAAALLALALTGCSTSDSTSSDPNQLVGTKLVKITQQYLNSASCRDGDGWVDYKKYALILPCGRIDVDTFEYWVTVQEPTHSLNAWVWLMTDDHKKFGLGSCQITKQRVSNGTYACMATKPLSKLKEHKVVYVASALTSITNNELPPEFERKDLTGINWRVRLRLR